MEKLLVENIACMGSVACRRPTLGLIEPEAVFGDIKQNHGFKRFKLKAAAAAELR